MAGIAACWRVFQWSTFQGFSLAGNQAAMDTNTQVSFSIPLPRDLRRALEREARADQRPVGQLIRKLLHDHVSARAAEAGERRAA